MNKFLHKLAPVLDRLARYGKIVFFLLLLVLVLCSMYLHLSGVVDADKGLVEAAGPSLVFAAFTAAIAEIAASMVRVHLKQSDVRQSKR